MLAAADGGQEVVEVVSSPAELLNFLSIQIKCRASVIAVHDEVAFATLKNHANPGIFEARCLQTANLKHQSLLSIIMNDYLGVCSVSGVNITKTATITHHGVAQMVNAQAPSSQVHLMDSLVSQIAITIRPLPMPIVVKPRSGKRCLRRWPKPKVIVDGLGRIVRRSAGGCPTRPNGATRFVT